MTGGPAPAAAIRKHWLGKLQDLDLPVLTDARMEDVLTKHRIRYLGGVDAITGKAFKEEANVSAILVTALEYYNQADPPKVALHARLVSAGDNPEILWMDSVAISGDEKPGILGLGLISDFAVVEDMALSRLQSSLASWLAGGGEAQPVQSVKKYDPKLSYNAWPAPKGTTVSIAAVPFYNETQLKRAGDISQINFVRQLFRTQGMHPVEPGVVRQAMLGMRMIMHEGVSVRDADVLTYVLGADFLLSGTVFEYQDVRGRNGVPKVDFGVTLIDKNDRRTVFKSKSYNSGSDGVFFYDVGWEPSASVMAGKMAEAVVRKVLQKP
ncbi:hypothetical protein KOM00_14420 [Geomonas sp. Red69]|uniref:hypothetical protein n=1 Tax=Geomonas diazotrophica TaxID=2843197 RepID=UPI001C101AB1|nr:hypothetical protein [Geomonas diazotrophica]MBU5637921.1 hypothetical protein [Geomonas diazotrophica]